MAEAITLLVLFCHAFGIACFKCCMSMFIFLMLGFNFALLFLCISCLSDFDFSVNELCF